jgi:hypothetical protein
MPAEPDRLPHCRTGFGLKSKPLGEKDNAKAQQPRLAGYASESEDLPQAV